MRDGVFISYSRKDSDWLTKIKAPLRFLELTNAFNIWDDTKINVGLDWNKEIESSIKQCKVAILLVSNNFLASEFILTKEIPGLLHAAKNDGAQIFNIILDHNVFEMTSLSRYQCLNSPDKPFIDLTEAEQQKFLVQLARQVKAALDQKNIKIAPDDQLPDFCRLVVVLSALAKEEAKTITQIEQTTMTPRKHVMECLSILSERGLIETVEKKPSTLWKATDIGMNIYQRLNAQLNV